MLQSIRDRTHGWIAGIIISLVILSFALWGIHSYLEGAGASDVIAKVNGTEITKRQLAAAYEPLRNQVQIATNASILPESVEAGLKRRALDTLIGVQVLKQASISQDFRVSESQVETYLQRMQEFQENGKFSIARFKQLLAANSLSVGDFLQLIHSTLLIDQPKAGIVLTSFALPNEVDNAIALVNQERNVAYIMLPRATFLKENITVTDAEITEYYQQHQDQFKTPEQVSVEYLELSAKNLAADIHPSEEALKNYYNDNIATYSQPAEWKLAKILVPVAEQTTEAAIKTAEQKIIELQAKLTGGADFLTLARQYSSNDKDSTEWLTLNQIPAELQKTVSTLKANDVSDMIKVGKGLMLVKAVGFKPAQAQPFEQVKDKVRDALVRQLSQEKFADAKEKLASLTYEHPESLEAAAKALSLVVKTTPLFTKDKAAGDISENNKVRELAFSNDVLTSQNNSDVLQLTPDSAVVIRVKSHIPASVNTLESVRQQVIAQIKDEKSEQKAGELAKEIKQKLVEGAAPEKIAEENHLVWSKVGFVGREDKKVESSILYAVFALSHSQKESQPSYSVVKTASGYAVVAALAVRDGQLNATKPDQREMFADQVQNTEGLLEYKLFEQSLTRQAKIKLTGDL